MSFEEVMGQLDLDSDELRQMVSEGKLRAFRSEDRMKFREDDVQDIARTSSEEPEIVLPDEEDQSPDDSTESSSEEVKQPSSGKQPGYLSFKEVISELDVQSEELRQMVSEGKLPAYRSDDQMKFKEEDIDTIAESTQEEAIERSEEDDEEINLEGMDQSDDSLDFEDLDEDIDSVEETVVEGSEDDDLDFDDLDLDDDEDIDLEDDLDLDESEEEDTSDGTEEMIFEDEELTVLDEDFEGEETMATDDETEDTLTEETMVEDDFLEDDELQEESLQDDELEEEPTMEADEEELAGLSPDQEQEPQTQQETAARKKAYAARASSSSSTESWWVPLLIFIGIICISFTLLLKVDEARLTGFDSEETVVTQENTTAKTGSWEFSRIISGLFLGPLVGTSEEGVDLNPDNNSPVGDFPEKEEEQE